MCALPTHPPRPHKLDLNVPRSSSLIPTARDAKDDYHVALRRFQHLCREGSQEGVVELLNQWPETPPSTGPLCAAVRHDHGSLIEYLLTQGLSLFPEDSPQSVPQAAATGAGETGNTKVLEVLLGHGWDISSGKNASAIS